MKVLFLDIDGVVTSTRANGFQDFDPFTVHVINWCCAEAGYKIVLSSTWRHADFDVEKFWQVIFDGHFHDDWRTTGRSYSERRGGQVNEWLERHPEVTEYVILDDDHDFTADQKGRAVFTDPHNGLLSGHFWDLKKLMGLRDDQWPRGDVVIHPLMFQKNQYEQRESGILLPKFVDEPTTVDTTAANQNNEERLGTVE